MHFLGRRLPPLTTLIAFEAAARHQSFTLAAQELSLTQAAISRQIRLLEENLGTKLFVRANRAVRLTSEGRDLQHTVTLSLTHIADGAEQIRITGGTERLNIATDKSVNALWLMPRLANFTNLHPDFSMRIVSSDVEHECLEGNIDVAILHGSGHWAEFTSIPLLNEAVFPVCSGDYLSRATPINSVHDLPSHPLIALEDDHWDWISWRVWLTAKNVNRPMEHHNMIMNDYFSVLQAARDGHGIALGWQHLIDQYLDDGSLVCPLGAECLTTEFAYYMLTPSSRKISTEAQAFVDWAFTMAP